MAEPREIRVKLTANVDEYIAGMERAEAATRKLGSAGHRVDKVWYFLFGVFTTSVIHLTFSLVTLAN